MSEDEDEDNSVRSSLLFFRNLVTNYLITCPYCQREHEVKNIDNYSIDCPCGQWLKRGE